MRPEWHMASVSIALRPCAEVGYSNTKLPHPTPRIKRLSPSTVGSNVALRLVLTLLRGHRFNRGTVSVLTSSADVFTANALTCDIDTLQDKQLKEEDGSAERLIHLSPDGGGWWTIDGGEALSTGNDKIRHDVLNFVTGLAVIWCYITLCHVTCYHVMLHHFTVIWAGAFCVASILGADYCK